MDRLPPVVFSSFPLLGRLLGFFQDFFFNLGSVGPSHSFDQLGVGLRRVEQMARLRRPPLLPRSSKTCLALSDEAPDLLQPSLHSARPLLERREVGLVMTLQTLLRHSLARMLCLHIMASHTIREFRDRKS